MKLIVGLGNPGPRYKDTRHNVGYRVAQRLADTLDIKLSHKRFQAIFGEAVTEGMRLIIAKPAAYMNSSGTAVFELMRNKKVALEDLLVVCDDAALSTGALRIKSKGSSGGHKGLESIVQSLGSWDFARLRIGIGRRPADDTLADYVLGEFAGHEKKAIEEAVEEASTAAKAWAARGIDYAMNKFNQRSKKDE